MNDKGININMDFKQWLSEMPIGNAQLLGKGWDKEMPQGRAKSNNYDRASVNMLKTDADRDFAKLRKSFRLVRQTIDAYFVKKPGVGQFLEIGEVKEEFLERLGIDVPPIDRSHITIFYTNNTGDEKMPLTPWTIAHRLGHALRRLPSYEKFIAHIDKDFRQLMELIYGLKKPDPYSHSFGSKKISDYSRFTKKLMMQLGTMRSARQNQLAREGEFPHELFAQAIINNKIEFNKEIPRQLVIDYAWGHPRWDGSKYSKIHNDEYMLDYAVELLESNARFYKSQVNQILAEAVGRIFIM